jgi:hypothetical protein
MVAALVLNHPIMSVNEEYSKTPTIAVTSILVVEVIRGGSGPERPEWP